MCMRFFGSSMNYKAILSSILQGVPKKMGLLSSFEFLGLGGVFLGVENNSKTFMTFLLLN